MRSTITHETPRLRVSSTQISPFPSNPHLFCTVLKKPREKIKINSNRAKVAQYRAFSYYLP